MKKLTSILSLCIISLGITFCTDPGLNDQCYSIKGIISDKTTGIPIDSAIIGMKKPSIPDSIIFVNDTVNLYVNNGFIWRKRTDSLGKYHWDWFLGMRKTELYSEIFVFKPGYKVWKFKQNNVKVNQLNESTDELNVHLEQK